MAKLTKNQIDQARPGASDVFLWDASLPGFGVRIKPSGTKSFICQYRNRHGRSRRQTIGRYGVLTLDEARRIARDELASTAHGRDPRQERINQRRAITVAELAKRYLTDHCEGRCKPSTIAATRWLLDKFIIPKLGRLTLSAVTSLEIDRLHQSLKKTPYNANRVRGLISALWGRAEFWQLVPKGHNPAVDVKKFKEHSKKRFLSPDELARLSRVLDQIERAGVLSPFAIAAFRLLLLTGARLNEIRKLKWTSVHFAARMLVIDDHKTDSSGPKVIPLNQAALEVIEALPRDPDNQYVIQGTISGKPYSDLEKPWRAVRKKAGLDDVRIHDLRHSFATFGIGDGIPLQHVGGLLGQDSLTATRIYAHLPDTSKRLASEHIGGVIAKQMFAQPVNAASFKARLETWRDRVSKGKQANLRGRKLSQRPAIAAAE